MAVAQQASSQPHEQEVSNSPLLSASPRLYLGVCAGSEGARKFLSPPRAKREHVGQAQESTRDWMRLDPAHIRIA